MNNGTNLYLIGYRGSGKSTVARLLAERLRRPWVDADEEIERRVGKTVRQIFDESGETAFRGIESAVLVSLAKLENQIVALGGGAILREENRRLIAKSGKAVWLRASPQTLLTRIEADPTTSARRPNLTSAGGLAEIERLLADRTALYEACADLTLDADLSLPEELAGQICEWLEKQSGPAV